MAGDHLATHLGEVARTQRGDSSTDPLAFGDDMTRPTPHDRIGELIDRPRFALGQRTDDRCGSFAVLAALRVGRAGEGAFHPRVDHEDLEVIGEGDRFDGDGREVDEQCMSESTEGAGQLVEQTTGHSDGGELTALTELGELQWRSFETERQRARELQ